MVRQVASVGPYTGVVIHMMGLRTLDTTVRLELSSRVLRIQPSICYVSVCLCQKKNRTPHGADTAGHDVALHNHQDT
jgi:hypothetical protein